MLKIQFRSSFTIPQRNNTLGLRNALEYVQKIRTIRKKIKFLLLLVVLLIHFEGQLVATSIPPCSPLTLSRDFFSYFQTPP